MSPEELEAIANRDDYLWFRELRADVQVGVVVSVAERDGLVEAARERDRLLNALGEAEGAMHVLYSHKSTYRDCPVDYCVRERAALAGSGESSAASLSVGDPK